MKNLFYGGSILTMARPLYAEALVTDGGKIAAVGDLRELRHQYPDAREVDLGGDCLMPAFIDPHSHFSQLAAAQLQISLDGVRSADEMRERIQAYIRAAKPEQGAWLTARDYDNNLLPGAENPTLAQIDSLAPGYRLIIHHKSGHMGLFNTAGLAYLGIEDDTPAPEGGQYGHTDGRLNGYMEENAFFTAIKQLPAAGLEEMMAAYAKAQDIYAAHGISYIQEGMMVPEMLPLYEQLLKRDILKLDLAIYCSIETVEPLRRLLEQYPGKAHIGGLKIFLDGSPQGRTAWMRQPYAGSQDYCGYGTMTDQQVTDAFRYAGRNGLQLIAHCNGDAAAEQFLRCLAQAEQEYPVLRKLRPVIIHGQLMGRDQLQRARDLGATVSFFVAHIRHWGDVHIQNFGMERAAYISPAASALRLGIPCTFHQDTPVLPPDMLETVSIAVSRVTAAGVQLAESEKLTPMEALQAVTVNAAWQYFEEAARGSLEAGKAADFVILSGDPACAAPGDIEKLKVHTLWKAGRLYERAGQE